MKIRREVLVLISVLSLLFYFLMIFFTHHGLGRVEIIDVYLMFFYTLGLISAGLVGIFSKLGRIILSIFAVIVHVALFLPWGFLCFDHCPDNIGLIILVGALSSYLFWSVLVINLIKNTKVLFTSLSLIGIVYFLSILIMLTDFGI